MGLESKENKTNDKDNMTPIMPADDMNLYEGKHACGIHNILRSSGLNNAQNPSDPFRILRSFFPDCFRLFLRSDIDRFGCADSDTLGLSPTEVTVIGYIRKDI